MIVRRTFPFRLLAIIAALLVSYVSPSSAQVTVQLPTFHVTGVSTTVLVPDGGSVYLGGVTDSSIGASSYGSPFGGNLPGLRRNLATRSFGRSTSTSNFWASATIIDHAELDRAVLAETERRQQLRRQLHIQPVAKVPQPRAARQFQVAQARPNAEADRVGIYLDRARRAEADDQPQIAKIFYRRIAKHGTHSQRQLAEQRLAAIEQGMKK